LEKPDVTDLRENRKNDDKLPRISVLPLAKLNKGSYTYILYDLLQKKFRVNVIGLPYKLTMSGLLFAIGSKSIIHLHWIEHKYTLGMVNRFGHFSKFFVLFTLPIFLLFLFVLRLIGCPIVTTLHNIVPHRVLFSRLEKSAFSIVLKLSKIVYVHTDHTKFQAMTLYGVDSFKIRKIHHGNWIHINSNLYTPTKARQILGIDSDAFVMCFIGRVSPDKGLHLLLDCLGKANINVPTYLILAGTPANKEYLTDLFQKSRCLSLAVRIKLYPYRISDAFVELLIKACDVGVLPYTKTSTPSTTLLFMSFGRPVIVPAFPEVKEFVGNKYPLLYDGSAEGLLGVIQKTISERAHLSKIGEDMLEKTRLFDWESTASVTYADYLELYRKN
jgi:glycosyltransferase involved in cell wall biosynthesis